MMYGQMTAGSWIYIGTQGILQGTYETFAAVGPQALRRDAAPAGWWSPPGLGGMGGAQPLAVTMNGGCALCVEVDLQRIERRIETGYLDERAADLDDALRAPGRRARPARGAVDRPARQRRRGAARARAPRRGDRRRHRPDQRPRPAQRLRARRADRRAGRRAARLATPTSTCAASARAPLAHVAAIRALQEAGAEAFDYGNALRGLAAAHGDADAFAYPGFVPAYIRPLFCEGKGPFRWVALSGDPADIHATDDAILELFGDQEHIARWIALARERVHFQGLPARICWLGYGERDRAGVRFNEMVASGELRGADRHRARPPRRRARSPRPSARPRRCATAPTPWPTGRCSTRWSTSPAARSWVSIHHGGGVGMGYSIHAGQVCVADGTPEAGERIRRVLTADPGMGIVRHADAGYPRARRGGRAQRRADADARSGVTRRSRSARGERGAEVAAAPRSAQADGLPYLRHDRAGELRSSRRR